MSERHTNGWVVGTDPVAMEIGGTPKNRPGIIFPSASRAATAYNSAPFFNPGARGIRFCVANDNANSGTATVKIQVLNPADGTTWVDLAGATSAAIGSSTGTITTVYPGLTGIADSAGVTINQHLGSVFRFVLTVGTGTCVNSVGADYLL